MNFQHTFPEWENTGAEPSSDLRTNGFAAGYKPPADIFNWFWSLTAAATTEVQSKLSAEEVARTNAVAAEASARTSAIAAVPKVYAARSNAVPTMRNGDICFIIID